MTRKRQKAANKAKIQSLIEAIQQTADNILPPKLPQPSQPLDENNLDNLTTIGVEAVQNATSEILSESDGRSEADGLKILRKIPLIAKLTRIQSEIESTKLEVEKMEAIVEAKPRPLLKPTYETRPDGMSMWDWTGYLVEKDSIEKENTILRRSALDDVSTLAPSERKG